MKLNCNFARVNLQVFHSLTSRVLLSSSPLDDRKIHFSGLITLQINTYFLFDSTDIHVQYSNAASSDWSIQLARWLLCLCVAARRLKTSEVVAVLAFKHSQCIIITFISSESSFLSAVSLSCLSCWHCAELFGSLLSAESSNERENRENVGNVGEKKSGEKTVVSAFKRFFRRSPKSVDVYHDPAWKREWDGQPWRQCVMIMVH